MTNEDTNIKHTKIIDFCRDIFLKKTIDYGTAWRIMRTISIIDQIYIKLQRIKNIQEKNTQKIEDSIKDELVGIINYSIIGLIQLELNNEIAEDIEFEKVKDMYNKQSKKSFELMKLKNHDYGEAWKNLTEISLIDLMLMKIHRMKQIVNNNGKTIVSEGIDANYLDLINYSIFTQILFYDK